MAECLDVESLRQRLERRYQIALVCNLEIIDGGEFETIRPTGLERGNGFCVILSRTHRQFEASFKADNFAGALLRAMSEVDSSEKAEFNATRKSAETGGSQIYVAVNGNDGTDCFESNSLWSQVDIGVSRRFPVSPTSDDLMPIALQVTSTCLSLVLILAVSDMLCSSLPDSSVSGLPEGAKIRVEVNRYERSPVNRATCIEHHGLKCQCCGFDFLEVYGEQGEGYVEVHHRVPVSQMAPNYLVDPVKDLIPLCGNCHAMIHRSNPPMSVDILKTVVEERRVQSALKFT